MSERLRNTPMDISKDLILSLLATLLADLVSLRKMNYIWWSAGVEPEVPMPLKFSIRKDIKQQIWKAEW